MAGPEPGTLLDPHQVDLLFDVSRVSSPDIQRKSRQFVDIRDGLGVLSQIGEVEVVSAEPAGLELDVREFFRGVEVEHAPSALLAGTAASPRAGPLLQAQGADQAESTAVAGRSQDARLREVTAGRTLIRGLAGCRNPGSMGLLEGVGLKNDAGSKAVRGGCVLLVPVLLQRSLKRCAVQFTGRFPQGLGTNLLNLLHDSLAEPTEPLPVLCLMGDLALEPADGRRKVQRFPGSLKSFSQLPGPGSSPQG